MVILIRGVITFILPIVEFDFPIIWEIRMVLMVCCRVGFSSR